MPKAIATFIRDRIDARKAHNDAREDVVYLIGHGRLPLFAYDPRTGKPLVRPLPPTSESRHYPPGAGRTS